MTAAGEKLFLTQPAISQQIRNLEEELGVELLVRGTRQIKATMQGQLLVEYARKIILLTQQAELAIQSMGDQVSGDLRIGTLNSIGLQILSPIVGLFLKHNSKLRIKLVYGRGPDLVAKMTQGLMDLVILPDVEIEYELKPPPEFEARFLMKDEMWLVGSGKESGLPRSIELQELVTRPVAMLVEKHPGFERELHLQLQARKIKFQSVFETTNVGTLKRVIESGLGWGFLPAHAVRKQVRAGRLVHVEVKGLRYENSIIYYFNKNDQVKSLAEVFYRALSQQIRS